MRKNLPFFTIALIALTIGCNNADPEKIIEAAEIPTTGYSTPLSYPNRQLIWNDEFDGNELDSDNWTFETGGNGWGNNELQYYTEDNVEIIDGNLVIAAKKEEFNSWKYTSSRIISQDKVEFSYGRIDVRAALPYGQGIWPAVWMLGANFDVVGWPHCGEIDIMEMIGGGGREDTVHGTVHWQSSGGYASYGDKYTLNEGTFSDEFHVFSIEWNDEYIRWYVDDIQYNEILINIADLDAFQNDFYFLINVAVGGNWPGNPTNSTDFHQFLIVDYVRVFQDN